MPENAKLKSLLLAVLQFTALLIEHSYSRHLYNSIEHLTTLLESTDFHVILAVLNLLYVFSKRSIFINRLSPEKKQALLQRLLYLAEVIIENIFFFLNFKIFIFLFTKMSIIIKY